MKQQDAPQVIVGLVAMLGMVAGLSGCGGQEFGTAGNNVAGSGATGTGGSSSGGASTGGSATGGGGHATGGTSGSGGSSTGGGGTGGATGGSTGTGGSAGGTQCGSAICGADEYCCNENCSLCEPFGISTCPCPSTVPCGPTTCQSDQVCCDATCGLCATQGDPCGMCGGGGVDCGPTVCGSNEQCCDSSCGACAPAGAPCPADPCGTMTLRCGRYNSCTGGELCCDSNCGTCSSGGACPAGSGGIITCPPDCTPMDISGTTGCDTLLGYKWDGLTCQAVSGCDCAGTMCDQMYATVDECKTAQGSCLL